MHLTSRLCLVACTVASALFLSSCQGLRAPSDNGGGGGGGSQTFTVTVTPAGGGSGTITSSPTGISCGTTCSGTFDSGTSITLTATPASDSSFAGWGGACSGSTACTITVTANSDVTATFGGSLQSVKHIIFMAQENEGFLRYFGKLNDYRAGLGLSTEVDGWTADDSNVSNDGTTTFTPFHMTSMCVENPSPSWNEAHRSYNELNPNSANAKLDGFAYAAGHDAQGLGLTDVQGQRVMSYYTDQDLPYYYFMATNFATSDRWFHPVMSRTPPNRMYMMSGTSAGHVYGLKPGDPNLTNKTIFQLADEHGLTWKVYVSAPDPTPIAGSTFSMFQYAHTHLDNIVPLSQFQTDLDNGTLPDIAYVEAGYSTGKDEHPTEGDQNPGGSVQGGSNFVATYVINPLMQSSSWKDSVFILTWDESGGFYDHVAPQPAVSPDGIPPSDLAPTDICTTVGASPTCDFTVTGYRIPMIVISPFAKKNYVSHTVMDSTAILKFIETRFNLPSLTARDGAQPDMTEFFDFVDAPWLTPPTPPAQPTNGPCYADHLP